MANFVTEDDKRIRDLQEQVDPLLSDFLAIDRPGWTAAMRVTLQQVVNMAAASSPFIKAYADVTNPDNAFGSNGDLFYTIPADGSSLKLSQKITDAWATVFVLPLNIPSDPLTFDQSNLVEVDEGIYSLSFDLPDGKSIASIETKAGTATRRIDVSQAVTDTANSPNTIIEGFDNNSAQTITIKLI